VSEQSSKIILVIDDEPMMRKQIRVMLEPEGFTVREAADGNEGLTQVALAIPNIVITDVLMPNKEGIETILELRHRYQSIRIIAMSGGGRLGNQDFLRAAKHLGADGILPKPFLPSALLQLVHELLAEQAGDASTAVDAGKR
jgi:CheY-like chemotaxis protein